MESRALAGYTGLKLCYLTGKDFIAGVLILFLHPLHKGRGWVGEERRQCSEKAFMPYTRNHSDLVGLWGNSKLHVHLNSSVSKMAIKIEGLSNHVDKEPKTNKG